MANDSFNIASASSGQGIVLPHIALTRYVKYFWYYSPQQMQRSSSHFRIIPSGCPGLIFHHDNGNARVTLLDGFKYPTAFVHGQDTRPCINVDNGNSTIVSVRLYPAALKTLFNIDAYEETDAVIPLDDLAGYNLTEQLLNAWDIFEVIELISTFLLRRINTIKFQDLVVEESINTIIENISTINPSELAGEFYISLRHLERKFKQFVGISPERYIQIMKFQKSINLIQQNNFVSLTDLTYELGFADQSHFIRQFKAFSGMRPREAFKKLSKPEYSAPQILQKKFKLFRFIYS